MVQFLYHSLSELSDAFNGATSDALIERSKGLQAQVGGAYGPIPEPELPGMRSLSASAEGTVLERIRVAIADLAPDAGAFYDRVREWRAVPPALVTLPPLTGATSSEGSAPQLVDRSKLDRWLSTEIGRCLAANADDSLGEGASAVDSELVEYVGGLLEHPDYCNPTLLALELHEFLGERAANFVLLLWKFLVVEIGISLVFNNESGATSDQRQRQAEAMSAHQHALLESNRSLVNATQDKVKSRYRQDGVFRATVDTCDYKRRRTSYRGKVGTQTGRWALRELIAKHMEALRDDEGGDATVDKRVPGDMKKPLPVRSTNGADEKAGPAACWWMFTDALRVRDMDRHCEPPLLSRWQSADRCGGERERGRCSGSRQPVDPRDLSSSNNRRSRSSSCTRRRRTRNASNRHDSGNRGQRQSASSQLESSRWRRSRSRSGSRGRLGRGDYHRDHHGVDRRRTRERRNSGRRYR